MTAAFYSNIYPFAKCEPFALIEEYRKSVLGKVSCNTLIERYIALCFYGYGITDIDCLGIPVASVNEEHRHQQEIENSFHTSTNIINYLQINANAGRQGESERTLRPESLEAAFRVRQEPVEARLEIKTERPRDIPLESAGPQQG